MLRVSRRLYRAGIVITTLWLVSLGFSACIEVQRADVDAGGSASDAGDGPGTTGETAAEADGEAATADASSDAAGDAGPDEPACQEGTTSCTEGGDVVSCVDGELVMKACAPHHGCFSGNCEPLQDCAALTECYFGCPALGLDVLELIDCQQDCIDHAEGDAAEQFTAIYQCLDEGCATVEKQEDGLLCLFEECPEDTSLCLYGDKGEQDCIGLLGCIDSCDLEGLGQEDYDACVLDCYRDATPSAHLKLLELTLCVAEHCSAAADDTSCWVKTTQLGGECATDWLACQTD